MMDKMIDEMIESLTRCVNSLWEIKGRANQETVTVKYNNKGDPVFKYFYEDKSVGNEDSLDSIKRWITDGEFTDGEFTRESPEDTIRRLTKEVEEWKSLALKAVSQYSELKSIADKTEALLLQKAEEAQLDERAARADLIAVEKKLNRVIEEQDKVAKLVSAKLEEWKHRAETAEATLRSVTAEKDEANRQRCLLADRILTNAERARTLREEMRKFAHFFQQGTIDKPVASHAWHVKIYELSDALLSKLGGEEP